MANTHPYISGPGNVAQMITQLRKSFPGTISSETVKKLGLAPNNESHVINVLQFIGVIDSEGKKTSAAAKAFSHHKDDEFAKSFSDLIGNAYSTLFELHGPGAWDLSTDELITFFRQSDQTSEAIGRRQAGTFKVLAGLAGHGEVPEPKAKRASNGSRGSDVQKTKLAPKTTAAAANQLTPKHALIGNKNSTGNTDFGLTVRVEINLPADGSKETYDNIFKSIKENLLGG